MLRHALRSRGSVKPQAAHAYWRCLNAKTLDELRTVCDEQLPLIGGAVLGFNGQADHVHLLIEAPPSQVLSLVVNNLKSVSSRMLRKWNAAELAKHYRHPVLWSRSYFVSSVGGANLETVKAYIEGQARPF